MPQPHRDSSPAPVRPMRLPQSILMFGIPAALFTLSLFAGLQATTEAGWSPFARFNAAFLVPLVLLLVAALVAYRLEGRPWIWSTFSRRMRLTRLDAAAWIWSLALAVYMFPIGPVWRLVAAGLLAWAALAAERRPRSQTLAGSAIIAGVIAATWAVPLASRAVAGVTFYSQPDALTNLIGHLQPGSFMGIGLQGQWWLIAYYLVFAMVPNIAGEELFWRGYILPRQERYHGRWTWVVHGVLWAAFHIFSTPDLGALVTRLPDALALSFVCQHTRNTWPGVIGHFVGNSPILILIVGGVIA